MRKNPFRPVKFEDESEPLIFVSEEAVLQSEPGNFFYTGKRGCGKTSTLKMADSIFQKISVSNYDDFEEVLGVYINLNNKIFPDFVKLRPSKKTREFLTTLDMRRQLTSEFLEKMLIRNFLYTLTNLTSMKVISLSLEDEEKIVAAYSHTYIKYKIHTLTSLVRAIEEDLSDYIDFARNLKARVDSYESRFEMKFHVFIRSVYDVLQRRSRYRLIRLLVDDCEVLPESYQVALNTLVRTPQGTPTSWSVSYVNGKYDARRTTINNQDLSREERQIRYLDELTDVKYQEFCAKIADKRLRRDRPNIDPINIVSKLGTFSINDLIEDSMDGSVSKRLNGFVKRTTDAFSGERKFYENFLYESGFTKGKLTEPALRRKNVAAYLGLCKKYGLQVRYAGTRPILSLSDGCIRDFLENMAVLFDLLANTVTDPIEYLTITDVIPIRIQNTAARKAAERKVSTIKHFNEENADLVEKFVEFIGHLVSEIQANKMSKVPLSSPERAIMGVRIEKRDQKNKIYSLIKAVELDGYAKSIDIKNPANMYGFRLHRQFAARFNYSYRCDNEAYFPLSMHHLAKILDPKETDAQDWALKVYRHWLQSNTLEGQDTFKEFDT